METMMNQSPATSLFWVSDRDRGEGWSKGQAQFGVGMAINLQSLRLLQLLLQGVGFSLAERGGCISASGWTLAFGT